MNYPLDLHLGQAKIPAHLLFEMLAYTIGYRCYVWQRARSQDLISDEGRMWIFLGAATGALLGSHLLGILENPAYLNQLDWKLWLGNKTIVGGLLGGLFGVEITKKIIGVNTSSGDLMAYPLMLAMAIGRIGCHLAGLTDGTHGNPSDLPWAVDFGDGIPRHPVNLYEVVFLGLLAIFIFQKEKSAPHLGGSEHLEGFENLRGVPNLRGGTHRLPNGMRFKIFMAGYLLWRFAIEFIKPVWVLPVGLSTIQMAAMAGLIYYRRVFWPKRTK